LLNNLKVIALLLSVSLLSGCNGTTGSGNSEVGMQSNATPTTSIPTTMAKNSPPAAGDPVRVARWSQPQSPTRMMGNVLLIGTLAIANNCLVVLAPDKDSTPMLPIFPDDRGVWDDAKQTFTYEGKVIRIGETIQVGVSWLSSFEQIKEDGYTYYDPGCGIKSLWRAA
jgi:hypothetical protein